MAASYGSGTARTKRDAVEAFLGFVSRVSATGGIDPLDQGLLVGRLSELLSVPAATVYDLLSKARSAGWREAPGATSDTSEESAYDASVRGLPAGMVSAVEELFGLALRAPAPFGALDESLALAAGYCPTWGRLLAIFRRKLDAAGVVNSAAVFEECEDAGLCELHGRSVARVNGRDCGESEVRRTAHERLVSELDLMRWGHLRSRSRQQDTTEEDRERAFRSLLEVAGRQHGRGGESDTAHVLGAAQRLGSSV
jgi:hypothetical protein